MKPRKPAKKKERSWKVWVDKDGHITSHRPYIETSPVEWIEVTESKKRSEFNRTGIPPKQVNKVPNIFKV